MTRISFFAGLLFTILSVLSGLAGTSSQRYQNRPDLVVARNHTHAFHLLAPQVGLEKGFFRDVNVRIFNRDLLPEFSNGDEMADAMVANGIQLVLDARVRTIFNQRTPRLVILAGWQEGTLDGIKLMSNPEIESVSDLKGLRVATSGVDSENAEILSYWLNRANLDPERDLIWVTGLSRNRRAAQALREGKVDAAFTSVEDSTALMQEGFRVLMDYQEVYPEGRVARVVAATREIVKQYPRELINFFKGLIRSYRLINDWQKNEEVLERLWQEELQRISDDSRVGAGENYKNNRLSSDGTVSRDAIQRALQEQKVLGKVDKDLQLGDILNLELVEQAVKELNQVGISYY